jgi:hypothetical protein
VCVRYVKNAWISRISAVSHMWVFGSTGTLLARLRTICVQTLQDWINRFWNGFEIPRNFTSLACSEVPSLPALLMVAVVAMIRTASSNSSANCLIRRGQKLYGATAEQLTRTMKETVSTWIVQHCKSTQCHQLIVLQPSQLKNRWYCSGTHWAIAYSSNHWVLMPAKNATAAESTEEPMVLQ